MNDAKSQPMSYHMTTVQRASGADRAARTVSTDAKRSWLTRAIHFLMLLVVLHQRLVGSQFIERPLPGDTPAWPYMLHEYIGLTGLVVVAMFWLWALLRRGETQSAGDALVFDGTCHRRRG